MKKFLKFTLVYISIMLVLVAFCGCKGTEGEVKIVVFAPNGEDFDSFVVDTTGTDMNYLVDALDKIDGNDTIEFSYQAPGGYIVSINGYVPVSGPTSGEFWAIYTDCKVDGIAYFDNSFTVDYNTKSYGTALKGITELPLTKGATYIIKLSTW